MRIHPFGVGALAAATLLCACSGGKHANTQPPSTLPPGVTNATDVPTNVPNNVQLRGNVQIGACKAVPGGWEATGTAINPTSKAITYTVTVFFTTRQATVVATGATKVDVKPGAHQPWAVRKSFAAPNPTLCVLRGVG
jgi:hypothetical protein